MLSTKDPESCTKKDPGSSIQHQGIKDQGSRIQYPVSSRPKITTRGIFQTVDRSPSTQWNLFL